MAYTQCTECGKNHTLIVNGHYCTSCSTLYCNKWDVRHVQGVLTSVLRKYGVNDFCWKYHDYTILVNVMQDINVDGLNVITTKPQTLIKFNVVIGKPRLISII